MQLMFAVMGVFRECHRKGTGRKLFAAARDYAVRKEYEFIQVKTVRSGVYEDYDITNEFYMSLGFKELEVLPDYWDEYILSSVGSDICVIKQ